MSHPTYIKVSERAFMQNVMELAKLYKWMVYHTHDSRRSQPGWPDLILVRGPRCIAAELKSAKGRLTAAQREWLTALSGIAGIETYCWRPDDWSTIVELLKCSPGAIINRSQKSGTTENGNDDV